MKSDTGLSLNDVQHAGPAIQNDIFTILLNFRLHNYVTTADISKMYRMILIDEGRKPFHRIFWRNNQAEEIKCYELQTITYGTASAPYLAIRCLNQLAAESLDRFPAASKAIKNNFYVDDFLYGADTASELIKMQHEVTTILSSAGFELRKWLCNDSDLYKQFRINNELECNIVEFGEGECNKTLGIFWNAKQDTIRYSSSETKHNNSITKRTLLSELSQIFDPLGLLGPVIIIGKVIMQELWKVKTPWDDPLPQDIVKQWLEFRQGLDNLNEIIIPRQIKQNSSSVELHGFGDASERAYGACIYVCSQDQCSQFSVHLLCAKSKVAPLKRQSLPRLELCAALLLARLMNKIVNSLEIPVSKCYLWSDSTITLAWIRACPSKWHTFVANRVSEVQRLTNANNWYHVSSKDNPADLLSRGVTIEQLKNNHLWWSGPFWLKDEHLSLENNEIYEEIPEQKAIVNLSINSKENEHEEFTKFGIFDQFSSFKNLYKAVAFYFRWVNNVLGNKRPEFFYFKEKKHGSLTLPERKFAINFLIQLMQKESFYDEFIDLKVGHQIDTKSRLLSLNPFMGDDQLIRVGGRLENSKLSFNQKHPIILAPKHKLSKMIVKEAHERLFHAGPTVVLSFLRERYWLLYGRNVIKGVIRNCRTCFLAKPKSLQYIMGNLPETRVNPYAPFINVGTDYAGPIFIRDRETRGGRPKMLKAYICVFVCMSTKAIHLEPVKTLTTDAFIDCLKRFISRRGKPIKIYSDNAKNFVGANSQLKDIYSFLRQNSDQIHNFLAPEQIEWSFIPARSPTFGGIWEAGVKSTKFHLTRVLRNINTTFEGLATVLCQIEAILNSRPLTKLTSDPEDPTPLTPGHFLIGRSLLNIPEKENFLTIPSNRLRRYQFLQRVIQDFWSKWSKEYISQLQTRTKWKVRQDQSLLQPGRVVLVREDNTPSMQWPLGLIVALHPGADRVVRVVSVKLRNSVVKRATSKICILPIEGDSEIGDSK